MLVKKILLGIVFLLGIVSGILSYFSHSFLLSLSITIAIYFSSYLAFRRVFELEDFLKETAIGYFGLWIVVWVILINLF